MAVNKVVLGSETLLDLTGDTVTRDTLLAGRSAHNAAGEQIEGEYTPPDVFTGASAEAAGTSGLVPPPAAGDEKKFLQGDGSWATPEAQTTIKICRWWEYARLLRKRKSKYFCGCRCRTDAREISRANREPGNRNP